MSKSETYTLTKIGDFLCCLSKVMEGCNTRNGCYSVLKQIHIVHASVDKRIKGDGDNDK